MISDFYFVFQGYISQRVYEEEIGEWYLIDDVEAVAIVRRFTSVPTNRSFRNRVIPPLEN